MAEKPIIEKVRQYAEAVRSRFPVKCILLFGSFAKGTQSPDSDIDVAVVLEEEPSDLLDTQRELYRLRRSIDVRIEPKLVDNTNDPSGFWEEISGYGQIVYGT